MEIRRSSVRLASAAVVLAAAALALAVSIQAQAANVTDTFKPTGGAQSWTVPAGVTSVTFDVFGAAGEEAAGQVAGSAPTPGGTGAHVQATLAVTPGETLEIVVGDQDGFNGGGAAGGFGLNGAGRGGGTSDVRAGACAASLACDLSSRVLVAGAGGGAGGLSISGSNRSATFGGVGGSAGSAGKDGSSFLGSGGTGGGGGAGGAGGASNGGSAGAGGTTSGGARPVAGSPGTAGMLGQGGAGGTSRITATGGGGGGGGGYYGGGSGGAVATNSGGAEGGGGGGGGGSSFVGPGAVGGVVAGNTGADGDGLVQITYTAQDVSIAIAGRNGLLGRGVISVAVFSTSDVDARTVDPGTVCFGDAEDPTQRDCTERDGKSNVLDMNHDRQPDVLLQFDTQESGIDPGDTQACLTGRTFDNRPIAGCASIVGIPTLLPLLGFPVFS